jgi:CBS domain-containing protein
MAEHQCGSVAVMSGEQLCGIFTESDLAGRVVGANVDPDAATLEMVMTREPATVDAQESAADAIRKMHECGFQHLPVLNGEVVLGMLSWRDLPFDILIQMQPELDERDRLTEHML